MKVKILIILIVLLFLGFLIYQNISQYSQFQLETHSPLEKVTFSEKSFSNWPMNGQNSAHHNFSSSEAPDKGKVFWSFNSKNKSDIAGLIYQDRRLYFSSGQSVFAFDFNKNEILWTKNLKGELNEDYGALAWADNKIIVQIKRGLQALDAQTGKKEWSYKLPFYYIFQNQPHLVTPPVVSEDKVFFGSSDDNLYALQVKDGKLIWKFRTKGNIHSTPAVANNKICFGTEDTDWSIYCLNASTGKVLWRRQFATSRETPGGMFHAPTTIWENLVLIGEEGGGRGIRTSEKTTPPAPSNFYALDINSGEVVWSYQASDWIVTGAAVGYGKVYFSSWDGYLYALDIKNGQLVWKGKGGWSPVVADGKVFVGTPYSIAYSPEKAIFAYNAENGEVIWKYKTDDIPAHLIVAEGKLYAGFKSEEEIHTQIIGFDQE